jgi:hypothetical protein
VQLAHKHPKTLKKICAIAMAIASRATTRISKEGNSMSPKVIKAYHQTEMLRPTGTGFVAKVEIVGIIDALRDDAYVFPTREEARRREVELAEKWKFDHAPPDREWEIQFCN